jgi:hypothetical protein
MLATTATATLITCTCISGVDAASEALTSRVPVDAVPVVTVPSLDYARLLGEDNDREESGQPPRFAVPYEDVLTPGNSGLWERIDMDTHRWQLRVRCENALSMNLGFSTYTMPSSGRMTVSTPRGDFRIRPFTADDNKPHGELWTPCVPGGEAIIEIIVDADQRGQVAKGIVLGSINSGYRWIHDAAGRGSSESCNVDVVCPEGDAWWDEIPSVGVYTLNGYLTCSGFMVNNTAQDQRNFFMTANHCGVTSSSDSSIVVYWNHQNSYCRTPGSGDSGGNGDGNFNQFTSGSTHRASRSYSDFTLTELSSSPNSAWGITYSGWSRASSASNGAGIHHPEAAEKRISFPDYTNASGEYWDINWGAGRTAPGSSGSPLFDGNHRAIGQLCCGYSYCWNDDNDYYGRSFNLSWSGSSSSSLGNWLDPAGTDPTGIDTLVPGGGGDPSGACCIGTSCTYVTEAACAAAGGSYQGDYVSCTSNPCGGDPTGACCVGASCSTATQADCNAAGGSYQGDGTSCSGDPCGGGGCPAGEIEDCNGNCCPDYWVGDGYCDDGTYSWNGVPIYLNCDQFDCDGGDCPDCGGGGGCPAGEIEDCNGNCCPDYWVGDGYCDDGTYSWNGVPIYLNCDQFDCDGGDCPDCGGGDPTGACCVDTSCSTTTQADCNAAGGSYLGDNTSCSGDPCGGGGDCDAGWTMDCQGTCFPDYVYEAWTGDGFCDDGAYIPADYGCDECPPGVAIFLNCEAFGCDGGDCECDPVDPTGACCVGTDCIELTQADCNGAGGEYQGDETACGADTCGSEPCPTDVDGNGVTDVTDLLTVIGEWGNSGSSQADVNGDGIVDVTDLLAIISAWGPC